jgi:hypothetical protein
MDHLTAQNCFFGVAFLQQSPGATARTLLNALFDPAQASLSEEVKWLGSDPTKNGLK